MATQEIISTDDNNAAAIGGWMAGIFAWLEVIIALAEWHLILTVIRSVPLVYATFIKPNVIECILVIAYTSIRYKDKLFDGSIKTLFWNQKCTKNIGVILTVLIFHSLCFGGIAYYEKYYFLPSTGKNLLSLDNFMGRIDLAFHIIILVPLREEIFYRAVIFKTLERRLQSPFICMLMCNLAFGIQHLMNINHFASGYLFVQIIMSMLIGSFYTSRMFASNGNIWEPIIMHIINNLFSSFISVNIGNDILFGDPFMLVILWITVSFYSILLGKTCISLTRSTDQQIIKED